MNKKQVFEIWTPWTRPWSTWVKPVLFSFMDQEPSLPVVSEIDHSWAPVATDRVAMVCDLPGVECMSLVLALAKCGYAPVPLFNAVPNPGGTSHLDLVDLPATIDLTPIVGMLWHGTQNLQNATIPDNAPPVFALDARRRGKGPPNPGQFDNRSVCFTTDFPSASFLREHGIRRVLLVQSEGKEPQPDVAHILRKWQEAGIPIFLKTLDSPEDPILCEVKRPSRFGAIWYRVLIALGLKRHMIGGFGGILSDVAGG